MQQLVQDHQRRQANWKHFSPPITPSWLIPVPVEVTPSIFQNTGSEVAIAGYANCPSYKRLAGGPAVKSSFQG